MEVTQRRAQVCGFASKIFATAANAEKLDYESNFFDAIYGSSTLHHIDIPLAANEVHRVLKPGGKAVFREPYEESRTLAALSKLVFAITPLRPDAVTPQRQLNHADVETLASIFSRVTVKPFGIFGRLDRILSNRSVLQNVHKLDRWLLDRFPTLGRIARHIVIECIK